MDFPRKGFWDLRDQILRFQTKTEQVQSQQARPRLLFTNIRDWDRDQENVYFRDRDRDQENGRDRESRWSLLKRKIELKLEEKTSWGWAGPSSVQLNLNLLYLHSCKFDDISYFDENSSVWWKLIQLSPILFIFFLHFFLLNSGSEFLREGLSVCRSVYRKNSLPIILNVLLLLIIFQTKIFYSLSK